MKKKILAVLLVGFITSSLMTNVNALDDTVQPRIMYVNEYTYEPSSSSKYNTYKSIGTVTLDNTGSSSQSYLGFEVQSTVTAEATVGISNSVETQTDAVVLAINTKTSFNVAASMTYSRGRTFSTNFYVPAGKNGSITGYIPAVKTEGRMKVDVYDYTSTDIHHVSTRYITMTTSYVPITTDVHFANKTW